jgi:hypothetical protein
MLRRVQPKALATRNAAGLPRSMIGYAECPPVPKNHPLPPKSILSALAP